ncbi:hypothetical protein ACFZCU_02905 [Streptomyces canus]|uniref:hypothetical protein n=1 Tax=Streptomyces canus TaxID=58343 RepID=UPI0036E2422A
MVHPEFARTGQRGAEDDGRRRPPRTADGLSAVCREPVRIGGSGPARVDASPVGRRDEAGDLGACERITFGRVPVTRLTRPAGASGADVKSGP